MREPARLQAALAAADALVARGRSQEAVALTESREPIARRHRDALPLAHSVLLAERASALRHAGRLVEATRLSERTYELGLARAWSAAGAGELPRARALALEAADLAAARGQHAFAARALHELCRLGDPAAAAPRLALLARRVDGPFAPAAAAHAAALAARYGHDLMQVAERFAGHAALLVAAEAASAAAVAFGEAGRPASGRAASARAAVWLAECEGARSPALLGTPEVDELTPREREISLLAASGLSSRRIAEQLVAPCAPSTTRSSGRTASRASLDARTLPRWSPCRAQAAPTRLGRDRPRMPTSWSASASATGSRAGCGGRCFALSSSRSASRGGPGRRSRRLASRAGG